MKAEGRNDSFLSCVSSSCRLLSRSEEGSQGRSELFCSSRSSSERSGDPLRPPQRRLPYRSLLGLVEGREPVIELADSAIDWNFNIDTESPATNVWKVISGRKDRSALTEIKLLVRFHHR